MMKREDINPLHGNIIYQLSHEDLMEFGRSIFLGLWEKISAEKEKPARHYTRDEVCSILRVSKPTFHSLANAGLIPILKVGRRTLIEADKFDALVASGQLCKYKHRKGGQPYDK